MKSVFFQGISVLKRALYYISSKKLPEAATVRSSGFRWGFVLNSSESALKEHPVLFLLDCWAWLCCLCSLCLERIVTVCSIFQPIEMSGDGIKLLEGEILLWLNVWVYLSMLAWFLLWCV